LSISSGAATFNDPEHFPWTVPGIFQYRTDARILVKQILASRRESKIALIYQNDDFGRDYVQSIKDVLGLDRESVLVKAVSYETIEPTVDSQIISLKSSGADTVIIAATPKAAAQAIRKIYDIDWMPARYMSYVSASIPAVLKPAGIEKSKGIATTATLKDPSDPTWADDTEMQGYIAFMKEYMPGVGYTDFFATAGYSYAENLVNLIKRCGDDLSRGNILKQATNIKGFRYSLGLPGVTIDVTAADYNPFHQARLQRFDGESWRLFGEVMNG
jgi:branched-chain amino acid transport system substrate-binding protein